MAMKMAGFIEKQISINNCQTICDNVNIIRSLAKVRARKKAKAKIINNVTIIQYNEIRGKKGVEVG